MSWQAMQWAQFEAPMPKTDRAARDVLVYLGHKADSDGRDAHPKKLSIAYHCDEMHPNMVGRLLNRLVDYGLISKDGYGPEGQTQWRLHMDRVRADRFDEFVQQHRSGEATRRAKYRDQRVSQTHSLEQDPSVTHAQFGTSQTQRLGHNPDVTNAQFVCHKRTVCLSQTQRLFVTNAQFPHNNPTTTPTTTPTTITHVGSSEASSDTREPDADGALFNTEQPEPVSHSSNGHSRRDYTEQFERFWHAFGKRGAKAKAAREWHRATTRASVDTLMTAVQAYVAATPEFRFRMHAERWLRDDCWDSAVPDPPSPGGQVNGHQPFTNPDDHSEYDQPLLPPRRHT